MPDRDESTQDVYDLFMTLHARLKMVLPEGEARTMALKCVDVAQDWTRCGLKHGPWGKRP